MKPYQNKTLQAVLCDLYKTQTPPYEAYDRIVTAANAVGFDKDDVWAKLYAAYDRDLHDFMKEVRDESNVNLWSMRHSPIWFFVIFVFCIVLICGCLFLGRKWGYNDAKFEMDKKIAEFNLKNKREEELIEFLNSENGKQIVAMHSNGRLTGFLKWGISKDAKLAREYGARGDLGEILRCEKPNWTIKEQNGRKFCDTGTERFWIE